ncbi:hypothetical protein ACWGK1_12265 [Streptomyces wedmorensis]
MLNSSVTALRSSSGCTNLSGPDGGQRQDSGQVLPVSAGTGT